MKTIRYHFPTIDSTNTWAKYNAHSFARDKLTLVTADVQTAGRGRLEHRWVSPANLSVYASFCFFLKQSRTDIANIAQVSILSAVAALKALGFQPQIKWPNDLLLAHKKVGGILCETISFTKAVCVIAGIGINVNMPPESMKEIDCPATSLLIEGGRLIEIEKVILLLQAEFESDVEKFCNEGFAPFAKEYQKQLDWAVGSEIRFHDHHTIWKGVLHSIQADGSLNLLLKSGEIKNFVAGVMSMATENQDS